jgi:hypothetical protein
MDLYTFENLQVGDICRIVKHQVYSRLAGLDVEVALKPDYTKTSFVTVKPLTQAQLTRCGYPTHSVRLPNPNGHAQLQLRQPRTGPVLERGAGHAPLAQAAPMAWALANALNAAGIKVAPSSTPPKPMTREQFLALQPGDEVLGVVGTGAGKKGVIERGTENGYHRYVRVKFDGFDSQILQDDYEIALIKKNKNVKYPHTCNRVGCGAPAYVGAYDVDCSKCGKH